MTVKITHTHRFNAPLDQVAQMLADVDFGRARAAALGADAGDVDVDAREDGSTSTSVRAHVPATSIPAELRPFVGRALAITYTEAWEPPGDDERVGTFAVEIAGTPGHVAGALGLRADGTDTSLLATGDVSAHVPLVGPMIEQAVAGAVERALEAQLAAADAWLSR